jgi:hypothetical protein
MLLHAIHADTRFGDMNVKGRIIFKSSDTDVLLARFSFLFQKMRMWCRNLLKHALQEITCIQEDPGYGKYHGLEDNDDHPCAKNTKGQH